MLYPCTSYPLQIVVVGLPKVEDSLRAVPWSWIWLVGPSQLSLIPDQIHLHLYSHKGKGNQEAHQLGELRHALVLGRMGMEVGWGHWQMQG